MRVWQADLRGSDEWIETSAAPVLTAAESERHGREPHHVWRRRVVARAALRIALGRHLDRPPRSLELVLGPGGKPRLVGSAGRDEVFFSLSRSGDLCLIAIGEEGPIGVDVEEIRDLPELEGLVRERFAASEATAILGESGRERLHAFYRCWTRKEACLKALATGIGLGLDSVVVSVGMQPALLAAPGARTGELSLLDLTPCEGFAAALAVCGAAPGDPGPPIRLKF